MPTINKKPNGSYEVQWMVKRKRHSKTFKTKTEAKQFSAEIELAKKITPVSQMTFHEFIDKHPSKSRSYDTLYFHLPFMPYWDKRMCDITAKDIQAGFDQLAKTKALHKDTYLSDNSLRRYAGNLIAMFSTAVKEGIISKNPCWGTDIPRKSEHREKVASEDDIRKLMEASKWDGVSVPKTDWQTVLCMFMFATQTGMRRGEIVAMERSWIQDNVIYLPASETKTHAARYVVMNKHAMFYLELMKGLGNSPRILKDTSNAWGTRWGRLRKRAGLGPVFDSNGNRVQEGLNFHDSRATFCTWAASRLDVLALARQTGHKNLKMLQRYYRPKPEEIAKLLDD